MKKTTAVPKDTDKMVRQLSLVAYLMSRRGRRIDARTIRWEVEGYGHEEQSFEAFARRFYADRDELASLGINIESEPNELGEGDVYWLPEENFFLPRVQFTPEELAALHTCLYLLDGQFAYSRLLRAALQSLALGTGNTLEDPITDCISVNLLPETDAAAVAARQVRIEKAISKRKTIIFSYHSMSRNSIEERRVDPYGQVLSRGEWYLVGHSRERDAVRMFKLKRIKGKIRNATRADHDFAIPEDFDICEYISLEPWQLGPVKGEAVVQISPRMGWRAAGSLSNCGEIELDDGGGARFRTGFADGGQLCSLVLGLGEDATLTEPQELRDQMLTDLEAIQSVHTGAPPEIADKTGAAQMAVTGDNESPGEINSDTNDDTIRASSGTPQVEPERFPLLAQTVSYFVSQLGGRGSVVLPVAEVCRDLGFDRHTLEQSIELLRLVSSGYGGNYLVEPYIEGDELRVLGWPEGDLLRRPVRLSPREARALLLAVDLLGSQVLAGEFDSLEAAREKILAAAGHTGEDVIPVDNAVIGDFEICRAVNRGLREGRLLEIEYLSREGEMPEKRTVEPYLLSRTGDRWYLVAWCCKRSAIRTFALDMIKSASLSGQAFEPREIDLDRYRNNPRYPSGSKPPKQAQIWFSSDVARRVREEQLDAVPLADGSLIDTIYYFDDNWLRDEVMKYRGQAVVLAPEQMRRVVADAAAELVKRYQK